MLSFYRALLHLRRAEDALSVGTFSLLELGRDVFGFQRAYQGRTLTILLNFSASSQPIRLNLPSSAQVVLSTSPTRRLGATESEPVLDANEGVVIRNTL
jgi:glycosidase